MWTIPLIFEEPNNLMGFGPRVVLPQIQILYIWAAVLARVPSLVLLDVNSAVH